MAACATPGFGGWRVRQGQTRNPDRWNSYSPRLSNGVLQLLEWLGFVAFSQGVCAIEFDSESQMKKQTFESVWDVLEKSPMN